MGETQSCTAERLADEFEIPATVASAQRFRPIILPRVKPPPSVDKQPSRQRLLPADVPARPSEVLSSAESSEAKKSDAVSAPRRMIEFSDPRIETRYHKWCNTTKTLVSVQCKIDLGRWSERMTVPEEIEGEIMTRGSGVMVLGGVEWTEHGGKPFRDITFLNPGERRGTTRRLMLKKAVIVKSFEELSDFPVGSILECSGSSKDEGE